MSRRAYSILAALSLCGGLAARDPDRPLWEQEAMLLYSEGASEFARLRSLGVEDPRMAMYVRAVETMHESFDSAHAEAEALGQSSGLFERLVADGDDDAVGLASRYYLARVAQRHPVELDLDKAKRLYLELFERHGDRFFGQLSFLKYATIEIYDDLAEDLEPLERIAGLEYAVERFTLPELRRNLHRILGEAYVAFDLEPRRALRHLEEAHRIGMPVTSLRIEVLESIGKLAEQLGENERALLAYDELLLVASAHERRAEFVEKARRLRTALNRSAGG